MDMKVAIVRGDAAARVDEFNSMDFLERRQAYDRAMAANARRESDEFNSLPVQEQIEELGAMEAAALPPGLSVNPPDYLATLIPDWEQ